MKAVDVTKIGSTVEGLFVVIKFAAERISRVIIEKEIVN
jgi:hypothetical protein